LNLPISEQGLLGLVGLFLVFGGGVLLKKALEAVAEELLGDPEQVGAEQSGAGPSASDGAKRWLGEGSDAAS
jgi:hypothetical protein